MSGPYHVYHVAIDMDGLTQGDLDDFRRALDRLEEDFAGVHLLGTESTESWPSVPRARESRPQENRDGR